MANVSPRVQVLAQLKDDIQHSRRVQSLTEPAAEINQYAPAQLRGVQVNDDAGLEHEADGMGAEASEAGKSNPVYGLPGETETSDRSIFTGQEVAQRKEVETEVKGLTHLVKKRGKSIHRSSEEHEVEEPAPIVVETNDRIRSRRGPNQEEFSGYDEVSPRLYRWYGVRSAPGLDPATDWYIREDTFDLEEHARPRVSRNLEREPGRRTRQSHHLVRFEVWHNTSTDIDPTGHMMMYEVRSQVYREYAQLREGGEITGAVQKLPDSNSVREMKQKFIELGVINVSTGRVFDKAPEPYYLAVLEMNREDARERRGGEKRKGGPRFNIMTWADVMFTVQETMQLDERGRSRKEQGFYYFVKEIQINYPQATRCLSWLEDAAQIQTIELIEGHAKIVLDDYIRKKGIEPYHTGQENI